MIYFDNAATSRFKPKSAIRAAMRNLKCSANPGRSSHEDAIQAAMTVHETREVLCDFIGASHHTIAFTKNCTEALNLGILGTAKLGGHVVTTAFEHNSVLRPLYMLKREGLISLSVVQPTKELTLDLNALEKAINEKTYLIAVTGMSNVTGYAPPLRKIGEIAAKHGVLLLVDGAQALGHIPLGVDEIGIDLLCGAGHKGLHGAPGTGFIAFHKNVFVNPLIYGGTGTESDKLYQPSMPPESLESGTLNTLGIASLLEGTRWTKKNEQKIREKTERISSFLHEELSRENGVDLYSVKGSPICVFDVRSQDNAAFTDALGAEFGIAVRYGLHCAPLIHKAIGSEKRGLIRASVGYNNTLKDAEAFVCAVHTLLKRNPSYST